MSRTNANGPPKQSRKKTSRRSTTGELPEATLQGAAAAKQLVQAVQIVHKRSRAMHAKADRLHRAAHRAHRRSTRVREAAGVPPRLADGDHIVVEENAPLRPRPFLVVGVGASAGGYEAFREFLGHLPRQHDMAVVLVQHLDPKHKSVLSDLLSQHSASPVVLAADDMELRPGNTYVIPENSVMTMENGRLRLVPRARNTPQPMPVDAFFRSLAEQQQSAAVGIVLSGTGSDGTLGLMSIKAGGGITFAQDEESAGLFGMPGSAVEAGAVDFVMAPGKMAGELARIGRHPWMAAQLPGLRKASPKLEEADRLLGDNPEELKTLFGLMRMRTGVDFSLYKQSTLKRRIARRMLLQKINSLGKYLAFAQRERGEIDELFKELLINVTSFFREPATFRVLRKQIFSKLLKNRGDNGALRFWVCGCSTGEEAYSLAMTLAEYFSETGSHRQVQIFSTDISDGSIEKARAGIYPETIAQDVPAERLRRFFTKVEKGYQVQKPIRDMCVFARQNVLSDPPFSNLDLISCRNVLIYFGPSLQRKLIPLFHYALRPGGFLLLGSSETIGGATEYFGLADKKTKIYARKNVNAATHLDFHRPRGRETQAPAPQAGAAAGEPRGLALQQQVDRVLLREFCPAAILVNSDMDVLQFRGRTGDYLEHAPGTATLNLLKMARESIALSLRATVARAIKKNALVRQAGVLLEHNKHLREITIEVQPFHLAGAAERFFLVVFRESSASDHGPEARHSTGARSARERREFTRLREELEGTKEYLRSVIEEQETSNEELRSANEEVLSSNEELQSTNEEIETAKEELQSTNEELTTLNEELQTRNTDLSQVNNDLSNLISNINVALIMVGPDLTIRRFTPTAEQLLSLIPSDIGRPLTELGRHLALPELTELVSQVMQELTPIERESRDAEGNTYAVRIRPYRTHDNKIDGAVILVLDIEELRRTMDTMMEVIAHPVLLLGPTLRVRHVNEAFLTAFGLRREEVIGRFLFDVADHQWDVAELRDLLENTLMKSRQVRHHPFEANFARIGYRKMLINARRFLEPGQGREAIIMSFLDMKEEVQVRTPLD